jgi:hypothetical protein
MARLAAKSPLELSASCREIALVLSNSVLRAAVIPQVERWLAQLPGLRALG